MKSLGFQGIGSTAMVTCSARVSIFVKKNCEMNISFTPKHVCIILLNI